MSGEREAPVASGGRTADTSAGAGWRVWVAAARPRTLPAAVAPVIVGTALAWRDEAAVPLAAGVCLAFALLVQIGTNFANDYYDFMHGADTAARVGPRRAVAGGLIAPAAMRRAMSGVFAVGFAIGLTLVAWGGPWLIVIGVVSILCGIAYTGGPWPLAYHGMGDLFVFIFFGLIAVTATYFVQAGRLTAEVWVAAAAVGLLTTNILVVNNYRDADTDRAAGKRTLVVRWGLRAARAQHAGSLAIAFAVPAWWAIQDRSGWWLLPLLLLPVAWCHVQRLRSAPTPVALIALLGETGKLVALYSVLFGIGAVLGR